MDYKMFEMKIEEFIIGKGRVTFREIRKEFNATADDLLPISNAISQLILKNCWRTEYDHSRLYVTTESAADKRDQVTECKHCDCVQVLLPKCIPADGDWVVTCLENNNRLYFDKSYTRDEVRGAFAKINKVKFEKCNAKMYHKVASYKMMQNF